MEESASLKVQVEITAARASQITALHANNVSVAQFQQATAVTAIEFAESLSSGASL